MVEYRPFSLMNLKVVNSTNTESIKKMVKISGIHTGRWYKNKIKQNKTVCMMYGIYYKYLSVRGHCLNKKDRPSRYRDFHFKDCDGRETETSRQTLALPMKPQIIGRIRLSVSTTNRTYELSGMTHVTAFRKNGKHSTGPSTYGPWVRTYSEWISRMFVLTVCSYKAQSNEICTYGRVSRGSLPRVRRYDLLYLRTVEYDHSHVWRVSPIHTHMWPKFGHHEVCSCSSICFVRSLVWLALLSITFSLIVHHYSKWPSWKCS